MLFDHSERGSGGGRPVRRACWVLGAVAAGIVLSHHLPSVRTPVWLGVAAIAQIAVWRRGPAPRAAMFVGAMLLSAAWHHTRIHDTHRHALDHLVRVHPIQTAIIRVDGLLLDPPRATPPSAGRLARFAPGAGTPSTTARLRVRRVETVAGWQPARGTLRLFIAGRADLRAGDWLTVDGRFAPVRPGTNPGSPDRIALAAQAANVGALAVPSPALLRTRPPDSVADAWRSWLRWSLAGLRAGARSALDRPGDPNARAIRDAILLGARGRVFDALADDFAHAGLLHLLAISGLHVGLLLAGVRAVISLTGDRPSVSRAIGTIALLSYLLLVPARPPVLRAAGMLLILTNASAFARRYDALNTLAWIAVLLLIVRPGDLWSLGFQLSVGVTAALIALGDPSHQRLFGIELRGRLEPIRTPRRQILHDLLAVIRRVVTRTTSGGVLAWLVSLPLIGARTGVLGPLTVPNAIVALPVVSVLLWMGFAAVLLDPLAPGPSGALADAATALAGVLDSLAAGANRLRPWTPTIPPMPWPWVVLTSVGVICWLQPARRRRRIGAILIACAVAWLLLRSTRETAPARIDMFDVGNGTCVLVRCAGPRGSEALLWDCGSMRPAIGVRELPVALRTLGVTRVRYAIVTHANLDHYSALPDVAGRIGLEIVFVTPRMDAHARRGSAVEALLDDLRSQGVRIGVLSAHDRVRLGDATLRVLAPDPAHDYRTENDGSLVARLDIPTPAGTRRVLLTGDIQTEGIARLLDDPRLPAPVDVLELPHHGSRTPIVRELIARTDPAMVLQSTGPRRVQDDPWRAARALRGWHTTAIDGAAHIRIDHTGVTRCAPGER